MRGVARAVGVCPCMPYTAVDTAGSLVALHTQRKGHGLLHVRAVALQLIAGLEKPSAIETVYGFFQIYLVNVRYI